MRLGTLELYRDTEGGLSGQRLADELVRSSLAASTLVEFIRDLASGGDEPAAPVGPASGASGDGAPEPAGWLLAGRSSVLTLSRLIGRGCR
jgi:hypothetical protein